MSGCRVCKVSATRISLNLRSWGEKVLMELVIGFGG